MAGVPVTCEDRNYVCCDLDPPVVVDAFGEVHTELTEAEYDEWYDRHVAAFEASR